MPDDVAAEKSLTLKALGARVEKVRPASIVDQKQVINLSWSIGLHNVMTRTPPLVCCQHICFLKLTHDSPDVD